MAGKLDNLEREVEQDMALLRALPAEPLTPASLDRVTAAVLAEAARISRLDRRLRIVRLSVAAAAVLVLAVGAWTLHGYVLRPGEGDPDALVSDWAAALDESNSRVAASAIWTRFLSSRNRLRSRARATSSRSSSGLAIGLAR